MRAAVFEGPGKMAVRDVDEPVCGDWGVRVRVRACAVCGTDVRIYNYGQKNVKPPHTIGHEIAGTVEEVGPAALEAGCSPPAGSRVVIVTAVGCGLCANCRRGFHNMCPENTAIGYDYPGGFAEQILVPEKAVRQGNVLAAPEGLSFKHASVVEPLSCCVNGQDYLGIGIGETVVIIGCGPIGCMHAQLARSRGATCIIMVDVEEKRLEMARRFGPDLLVNGKTVDPVAQVMEQTGGVGAEVVIAACSAPQAQQQALEMAAKKGRVSFFAGVPRDKMPASLDSNLLHYRELSVYGAYASYAPQYDQALRLMAAGRIDAGKFVTHTFPLEDIVEAMQVARSGEGLKVVIQPGSALL